MARACAIVALVVCLGLSGRAWAQEPAPDPPPAPYTYSAGPVSLTVAMAGTVVAAAGFGLMLKTIEPCYCEPRTAWVVGGVIVVAAGVTMVWLGLRDRRVTVLPIATPHTAGGLAVIRWGAPPGRAR